MSTPVESLQSFIKRYKLDEVLMIWPTGTGKTNAAAWTMYRMFEQDRIDYVIVLVLKKVLKTHLAAEFALFFDPTFFTIYDFATFHQRFHQKHAKLMNLLHTKRIGFFVDEIDQLIPRIDHVVPTSTECVSTEGDEVCQNYLESDDDDDDDDEYKKKTIAFAKKMNYAKQFDAHWKSKYFDMMVNIWNLNYCYLTRFLLLGTATPFVSNLENELEKYCNLVTPLATRIVRNMKKGDECVNKREEVMRRVHVIPKEIVRKFFPCVVDYMRNRTLEEEHAEIKIDEEYPAFLVERSIEMQRNMPTDDQTNRQLSTLFPHQFNRKLELIREQHEHSQERGFVMCYLKQSQANVVDYFTRHNINIISIYSEDSTTEIRKKLAKFRNDNSFKLLVTTEFLNSGISIPNVTRVHIVEPFVMYEPTTTIQSVGRCARLNSHDTPMAQVVVRIWLYVWVDTEEVTRYEKAMQRQNEFRKFFREVELYHRKFYEEVPFVSQLKHKEIPSTHMIHRKLTRTYDSTEIDSGVGNYRHVGSNYLVHLYPSENFATNLTKMFELCSSNNPPVRRSSLNVVYGGILVTDKNSFDMSACPYGQVLRYDDATRLRILQLCNYIREHGVPTKQWTFISGKIPGDNLRRHIITRKEAENVQKKKNLQKRTIKGAILSSEEIQRRYRDIVSSELRSSMEPVRLPSSMSMAHVIVEHAMSVGLYLYDNDVIYNKEDDEDESMVPSSSQLDTLHPSGHDGNRSVR